MEFAIDNDGQPETVLLVGGGGAAAVLAGELIEAGRTVRLLEEDESDATRCRDLLSRLVGEMPEGLIEVGGIDGSRVGCVIEAVYCGDAHRRWWLTETSDLGNALRCYDASVPLSPDICEDPALIGLFWLNQVVELFLADDRNDDADALSAHIRQWVGRTVLPSHTRGLPASVRLSDAVQTTADRLLLKGATPWDVDDALKAIGFRRGPYEMQDQVGLDAAHARRKRTGDRTNIVGDRMVAEGRLGRRFGVGWYRYPGGGGAVIDPLLEDLISEEAHFAGIERHPIDAHDIQTACLSALKEAARELMLEGVLAGETDLSVLTHALFGVPPEARGVMHYISKTIRDIS